MVNTVHDMDRSAKRVRLSSSVEPLVYNPSTCSVVRLQARLRVQSTHDKIVGESAGSRSGGRGGPVHGRGVYRWESV